MPCPWVKKSLAWSVLTVTKGEVEVTKVVSVETNLEGKADFPDKVGVLEDSQALEDKAGSSLDKVGDANKTIKIDKIPTYNQTYLIHL